MQTIVLVVLVFFINVWKAGVHVASASGCLDLGFTPSLVCSACDQLPKFGLDSLSQSCQSCCQRDVEDTAVKRYPYAELLVCGCNLGRFPQVQAFVKSGPNMFPGLEVRYARGVYPTLNLLNEEREVVEKLSVEKWNTDTLEEFLSERLQN